jgi:hypothetical protein
MLKDKWNSIVVKVKDIDKKVVVKVAVIGVAMLLAVGLAGYALTPQEPELLEPGDEYYETEEEVEEEIS